MITPMMKRTTKTAPSRWQAAQACMLSASLSGASIPAKGPRRERQSAADGRQQQSADTPAARRRRGRPGSPALARPGAHQEIVGKGTTTIRMLRSRTAQCQGREPLATP